MINIHVPDMHCGKCVERITKALNAAGIKSEVVLESKTVTVEEKYNAKVLEILDDLGFEPEN